MMLLFHVPYSLIHLIILAHCAPPPHPLNHNLTVLTPRPENADCFTSAVYPRIPLPEDCGRVLASVEKDPKYKTLQVFAGPALVPSEERTRVPLAWEHGSCRMELRAMDISRTDVFALKDVADRGARVVKYCVEKNGPNRSGGWSEVGNARGFIVFVMKLSP